MSLRVYNSLPAVRAALNRVRLMLGGELLFVRPIDGSVAACGLDVPGNQIASPHLMEFYRS